MVTTYDNTVPLAAHINHTGEDEGSIVECEFMYYCFTCAGWCVLHSEVMRRGQN
ncbi:Hypothetical protein SMAX5B_022618, partial [Scophthalmus maximus]